MLSSSRRAAEGTCSESLPPKSFLRRTYLLKTRLKKSWSYAGWNYFKKTWSERKIWKIRHVKTGSTWVDNTRIVLRALCHASILPSSRRKPIQVCFWGPHPRQKRKMLSCQRKTFNKCSNAWPKSAMHTKKKTILQVSKFRGDSRLKCQ